VNREDGWGRNLLPIVSTEANQMVCPKCGGTAKVIAFLTGCARNGPAHSLRLAEAPEFSAFVQKAEDAWLCLKHDIQIIVGLFPASSMDEHEKSQNFQEIFVRVGDGSLTGLFGGRKP
jgi:hypothetical protein